MIGFPRSGRPGGPASILAAAGVLAVLVLAGCAPKVDTEALAKHLTQLDDEWSKSAATRNAGTVGSYYAADAIAYPPGAPVAVGQEAAQKVWAGYFADSMFSISWTTTHARVAASGDIGFTAGTYEDSYRGADSTMVEEKGKYLCVWAKQADGSWKAVHDMWNADGP